MIQKVSEDSTGVLEVLKGFKNFRETQEPFKGPHEDLRGFQKISGELRGLQVFQVQGLKGIARGLIKFRRDLKTNQGVSEPFEGVS